MSSKKDDKEREIAEKKAGKKGKKKRSGIPAIVLLLALIALLLYIFLGNGFGLGDKMGFGKAMEKPKKKPQERCLRMNRFLRKMQRFLLKSMS